MTPSKVDDVTWLEPWGLVDEQHRDTMAKQLRRELVAGHVLFGRDVQAIARRHDQDDILFVVEDPPQFAVVHLTYAREARPEWPHTIVFDSISEFIEACMMPDHEEFTDDDVG